MISTWKTSDCLIQLSILGFLRLPALPGLLRLSSFPLCRHFLASLQSRLSPRCTPATTHHQSPAATDKLLHSTPWQQQLWCRIQNHCHCPEDKKLLFLIIREKKRKHLQWKKLKWDSWHPQSKELTLENEPDTHSTSARYFSVDYKSFWTISENVIKNIAGDGNGRRYCAHICLSIKLRGWSCLFYLKQDVRRQNAANPGHCVQVAHADVPVSQDRGHWHEIIGDGSKSALSLPLLYAF